MKYLLAAVLSLAAAQASAGYGESVELGKKLAMRAFGELQEMQFRKLYVVTGTGGKHEFVCGEISARNLPGFVNFYVALSDGKAHYKRGGDYRIWDELMDAVCATD